MNKIVEQSTPDHAAQAQPAKPNAGRHGGSATVVRHSMATVLTSN